MVDAIQPYQVYLQFLTDHLLQLPSTSFMITHLHMSLKQNILDKNLNFNKHIDIICKKANASLAFIRRNTYFCTRNIKNDAYKTYVLPIMDSFGHHTGTAVNINKLEDIQRRAARFVMSKYDHHSSVTA